jgi:UDP-N-acetylmuramoyl-L-alanyl-D-glutamate--2,6-diaminopimelate ligase
MMDRIVSLRKMLLSLPYRIDESVFPDLEICSVTADSRKVISGSIFVACSGEIEDGHNFIDKAVENGAVAIFGEKDVPTYRVPYFRVENSRQALAYLAAAYFDHPAKKMVMIGITGTDGKTTTANLLYSILQFAGYQVGLISTVNAVIGDKVLDTGFHVTTPDAPDVQQYLDMMFEAGITHVVLETTSHGWSQFRVDACDFDLGIITNITHEHLDHHGSFENYRAAKARLFESLSIKRNKIVNILPLAILNRDDASFEYLKSISKVSTVSYGKGENADVLAKDILPEQDGLTFDLILFGKAKTRVRSKLVGSFNVSNCLAAIAAATIGLGIDPLIVANGIANMTGVPGRMEQINSGQDFTAIVDFAHTPNALRVVLETARQMTKGKLIAIFGSAGLRDRKKRRLMAETSTDLADISIFTAEDPRTESLGGILNEMALGAYSRNGENEKDFWCIPDRREAIRLGIKLARSGDMVICCGKGHEQSMCFGTIEYPWDDRTAMRAALAEMLGIDGPGMPYLPPQEDIK